MMANANFLGSGWAFPVRAALDSRIEEAHQEESIRQAIWIILGTSRGERLMRPDFGCGIQDLVFSVNDATTSGLIADDVRQALLLWEPRIDLLDVQVSPALDDAMTLLIRVDFRVRATNSRFNLVYPFFLG
jgi:phage baseplate assembly protein W